MPVLWTKAPSNQVIFGLYEVVKILPILTNVSQDGLSLKTDVLPSPNPIEPGLTPLFPRDTLPSYSSAAEARGSFIPHLYASDEAPGFRHGAKKNAAL